MVHRLTTEKDSHKNSSDWHACSTCFWKEILPYEPLWIFSMISLFSLLLACSQTLYFLLRDCRAHIWNHESSGDLLTARARGRACSHAVKLSKEKIKTSVDMLVCYIPSTWGAKLHRTNILTPKCQKSMWLNALVNNLTDEPERKYCTSNSSPPPVLSSL